MSLSDTTTARLAVLSLLFLIIAAPSATAAPISDDPKLNLVNLQYEPVPARAGDYVDLWLKVENLATQPASNVTCELIPDYPFQFEQGDEAARTIGKLPGGEVKVFQYQLRVASDAVEGWNTLDFRCRTSPDMAWISREIEIKISEGINLALGDISAEPLELRPDTEDATLRVGVQNVGGAAAELVQTQLSLPDGITPSTSFANRDALGLIEAGSQKTAEYTIDIADTVEAGSYTANMTVSYSSDGERKQTTLQVPITVKGAPVFEITNVTTTPPSLMQGDSAQLRVTITNVGSEEAESASAKIYKQSDQPFTFDEKYDFLGSIGPGETQVAVFHFDVESAADLKQYLLDLEIRYVTGNDVHTTDRSIGVRVGEEATGISTQNLALGLIAILLLAGIVYTYWNHRELFGQDG
ncbi:MAG: COG1361 S-layer family protein [Candidatus Nanohaloarchaea archaeon]|nr:COG1361 S-layer family protein [Candidatus Nanohaloarchaea archaeon]